MKSRSKRRSTSCKTTDRPTIPLTLREGQTLQIRILETDIPKQPVNQAALDLLRSWQEDGDEQEQKETWEFLQSALDADRLSDRPRLPDNQLS